jgi:hypothetical protein
MIDIKNPSKIWDAYDNGRGYKSTLDLYDIVEENERFYIGDQWHGLNAPHIIKPVLNYTKRTVSMLVAKICSDDIAARITPFLTNEKSEEISKMIGREVDKIVELQNVKKLCKRGCRNAAVDGDGCIYTFWDADAPTGQDAKGMISAELIDNINVIFANPHTTDVQGQRYIIIARRLPVEDVRDRAEKYGIKKDERDSIVSDSDSHQGEQEDGGLCTLLTVLFKKDGTVHAVECTEKVIVRKEWDLELRRYPIAWFPWEQRRSSMHGVSPVTSMIPNQIAVNKIWAGLIRVIERMGFPIMLLNRTFAEKDERGGTKWRGTPGSILEIASPSAEIDVRRVASYLEGAPINPSITQISDSLVAQTRDTVGTNDATSGNVRPDNASAIIALQTADTVPLELIRQNYCDWIEELYRNIVDMIAANYGNRAVEWEETDPDTGKPTNMMQVYDFDTLDYENLRINVDIGAASMWSEITQMDAINSIFTSGIMDDLSRFKLYLETIPDKYVPNKAKLLAWVDEQMNMVKPMPETPQMNGELMTDPYGNTPLGNTPITPIIA